MAAETELLKGYDENNRPIVRDSTDSPWRLDLEAIAAQSGITLNKNNAPRAETPGVLSQIFSGLLKGGSDVVSGIADIPGTVATAFQRDPEKSLMPGDFFSPEELTRAKNVFVSPQNEVQQARQKLMLAAPMLKAFGLLGRGGSALAEKFGPGIAAKMPGWSSALIPETATGGRLAAQTAATGGLGFAGADEGMGVEGAVAGATTNLLPEGVFGATKALKDKFLTWPNKQIDVARKALQADYDQSIADAQAAMADLIHKNRTVVGTASNHAELVQNKLKADAERAMVEKMAVDIANSTNSAYHKQATQELIDALARHKKASQELIKLDPNAKTTYDFVSKLAEDIRPETTTGLGVTLKGDKAVKWTYGKAITQPPGTTPVTINQKKVIDYLTEQKVAYAKPTGQFSPTALEDIAAVEDALGGNIFTNPVGVLPVQYRDALVKVGNLIGKSPSSGVRHYARGVYHAMMDQLREEGGNGNLNAMRLYEATGLHRRNIAATELSQDLIARGSKWTSTGDFQATKDIVPFIEKELATNPYFKESFNPEDVNKISATLKRVFRLTEKAEEAVDTAKAAQKAAEPEVFEPKPSKVPPENYIESLADTQRAPLKKDIEKALATKKAMKQPPTEEEVKDYALKHHEKILFEKHPAILSGMLGLGVGAMSAGGMPMPYTALYSAAGYAAYKYPELIIKAAMNPKLRPILDTFYKVRPPNLVRDAAKIAALENLLKAEESGGR